MGATNIAADAATVLVVDDHPMIRDGIKALLSGQPGLAVCGEAGTIAEARRLAQELKPNLILLDLHLSDGDCLELLEELRGWADPPRVLVLTAHNDQDQIASQALVLGASGFVNKRTFGDELLRIIRESLAGKTYLSPDMIARLVRQRGR